MSEEEKDFTGADYKRKHALEAAQKKEEERIDPKKIAEKAALRRKRVLQAAQIYTESQAVNDIYATLHNRLRWLDSQCIISSGNSPEARMAYTERKDEVRSIIESIEKVIIEAEEYKKEST